MSTRSMTSLGALQHIIDTIFSHDIDVLKQFFKSSGVHDIDDFMSIPDEIFKSKYSVEDGSSGKEEVLKFVMQNKLNLLQQWFISQDDQELKTWYSLTPDLFNNFRKQQTLKRFEPVISTPVLPTPSTPSFRSSIKINLSDYPKLKEDTQWRSFNRQFRATAASHNTLDILDNKYIPTPLLEESFQQKQNFMYNVFIQCLLTSKGKVCVRAHAKEMDAQSVYADLIDTYDDQLSIRLDASKLRAELTVMKLDDKWRKGYETFLTFWSGKIQELESILDKEIDDETKRTWLTNTLESQRDMNSAIRQATTTELTFSGMNGTSANHQISWDHFYCIVLSTAKMLDNSKGGTNPQAPRQVNSSNHQHPPPGGRGCGGRTPPTRTWRTRWWYAWWPWTNTAIYHLYWSKYGYGARYVF